MCENREASEQESVKAVIAVIRVDRQFIAQIYSHHWTSLVSVCRGGMKESEREASPSLV